MEALAMRVGALVPPGSGTRPDQLADHQAVADDDDVAARAESPAGNERQRLAHPTAKRRHGLAARRRLEHRQRIEAESVVRAAAQLAEIALLQQGALDQGRRVTRAIASAVCQALGSGLERTRSTRRPSRCRPDGAPGRGREG
jgi:hypothetical protein